MLYIFVEGFFDELFLGKTYFSDETIRFIQYSSLPLKKVNDFIKSIKHMPTCDYLFFGDGDGSSISDKKDVILNKYSEAETDKVYIVQYEIESWYYAGISESDCKKLKLTKFVYETDDVTKEDLIAKMPKSSERQYIMSQMLDFFSKDIAVKRNTSFKLFYDNMEEPVVAV